ncbi:glycoside hydrolase family 2 protein [Paenibacillus odorifer]|uniref:glycoside hydrolase family 2 protein n=1 Tax=Paenibacillus odorifer TaxID=189426 RepID=UPI0022B29F89|nr:glycoside hydrolase family 2 protein [Paenibacillus odorifer]
MISITLHKVKRVFINNFKNTVKSKAYARFVGLDFKERDAIFSDNYFDLSAGVSRIVTVAKQDLDKPATAEELRAQLTVRSVFDI